MAQTHRMPHTPHTISHRAKIKAPKSNKFMNYMWYALCSSRFCLHFALTVAFQWFLSSLFIWFLLVDFIAVEIRLCNNCCMDAQLQSK